MLCNVYHCRVEAEWFINVQRALPPHCGNSIAIQSICLKVWINGWIECVFCLCVCVRAQRCANCLHHLIPFHYLCFDGDCQHETANEIEWRNVWNVACSTLIISTEAFQMPNKSFHIFPRRPEKSHPTSMSWLFFVFFPCWPIGKYGLCNIMIYGMDISGVGTLHMPIDCNYF